MGTEGARQGNERGGAKRGAKPGHPDQVEAAREIAHTLETALGAEVRVRPAPAGGYRVELSLESPQEAHTLARRLAERALESAGPGD
ncbi:MAG: hypothetical protein FWD42_10415 [Solirubrobacterales bacterium]|nr:hypothetical protein [Solirubrobacterales bacterium]